MSLKDSPREILGDGGINLSFDHRFGIKDYFESIDTVFDAYLLDGDNCSHAALKSTNLGRALMSKAEMHDGVFLYNRDEKKIGKTGLDLILVQYIQNGNERRVSDKKEEFVKAGDICLLDLTRSFSSEVKDCTNLTFAIPRNLLGLDENSFDALHGLVLRSNTAIGQLLGSHLVHLWQQTPALSMRDAIAASTGTIDLISALIAPSLETEKSGQAIISAQVLRVRRYIEENLHDPNLGPDALCGHFGVSRAGMYRLFAPLGGVAEYIRTRRLKRAFDTLINPALQNKTISSIAYDCGFSEINTFARAFKLQFQYTPSEIRDSARQNTEMAGVLYYGKDKANSLRSWLRDISINA